MDLLAGGLLPKLLTYDVEDGSPSTSKSVLAQQTRQWQGYHISHHRT